MFEWRRISVLGFALALVVSLTTPASAQNVSADLSGKVMDQTGAVIPGVTVVVTQVTTGRSRTVLSNDEGDYEMLRLEPSEYSVKAELPGFKAFEQRGIKLEVNQHARLDIVLQVGSPSEVVVVEANVTQVELKKNVLGKSITDKHIGDLPLIARDYLALAAIQPGVITAQSINQGQLSRFQFSVNGQRGQANNYLLEGADNNDLAANFPDVRPNVGAIEEFKILTSGYDPEFGRSSGGHVNAVIKSGTSEFHGGVFEFLRNTELNTANFFTAGLQERNADGSKNRSRIPVFQRNAFGFAFGGPFYFGDWYPKGKTFFFGAYEGVRQIRGTVLTGAVVPDAKLRSGDLTDLVASGVRVVDPRTGLPFPNNRVPDNRIHPISKTLLEKFVPLPNGPVSGGRGQFSAAPGSTFNSDQMIVKVNHSIRDDNNLAATYIMQDNRSSNAQAFIGANIPGFGSSSLLRFQNVIVTDTHTFTPTFLNEFRFAFHRRASQGVVPQNRVSAKDLGFTGIFPDNADAAGPPRMFIAGFWNMGNTIQGPQSRFDNTWQWQDNAPWTFGRHSFKFGTNIAKYQQNQLFTFINNGLFSFNRDPATPATAGDLTLGSGNSFADFLLGLPDEFDQATNDRLAIRAAWYHFYFADDLKVTDRLTLNFGVRYELNTPTTDFFGRVGALRPGQRSSRFGNIPTKSLFTGAIVNAPPTGFAFPGDPGISQSTVETDKNNWSPRLGFAFSPFKSGKMAVRGGFGVYYDLINTELQLQFLGIQPFGISQTISVFPGYTPMNTANPLADPAGRNNVFTAQGRPPLAPFFSTPISFTPLDQTMRTPYSYQYSLGVQYELFRDYLAEVNYVGSIGRKLLAVKQINFIPFTTDARGVITIQPQPGTLLGRRFADTFFSLPELETYNNSVYNSLQVSVNKRFSRGFSFLGAWTYSHNIDDGSAFESFGGQNPNPLRVDLDRSNSDFDTRHRFTYTAVWELPVFRDQRGVFGKTLGGWQINGIVTLQTGFPFTPVFSGNPNGIGVLSTPRGRYFGGEQTLPTDRKRADLIKEYFNTKVFGDPRDLDGDGRRDVARAFGNIARNTIYGPGFANVDFSVIKRTKVTEGTNVEFRAEFFNFFNRVNLGNPATGTGANIASVSRGRLLTAGDSRLIQFGLKFNF